ncbi:hypothetical protein G9A89_019177 [Geosiphon pyriformis]|nr:hypothetical protein G9A89_019177 [Geosiphon pyriformis]
MKLIPAAQKNHKSDSKQTRQNAPPPQQQSNSLISRELQKIINWLLAHENWETDVLKFLLLCIAEPKDSFYRFLIESEWGDIKNAINYFSSMGITNLDAKNTCIVYLDRYKDWHNNEAKTPLSILAEDICEFLLLEKSDGKWLVNCLARERPEPRSALRSIFYHRIKGMHDILVGKNSDLIERNKYKMEINCLRTNYKLLDQELQGLKKQLASHDEAENLKEQIIAELEQKLLSQTKQHEEEEQKELRIAELEQKLLLQMKQHEEEEQKELRIAELEQKLLSQTEQHEEEYQANMSKLREEYENGKQNFIKETSAQFQNNLQQIQRLQEERDMWEMKHQSMQNESTFKDKKIQKLSNQTELAKKEAAELQAALGSVRNVQWNDNDENNAVKLTHFIEKIQRSLEDVTKVKGKKEIRIHEALAKNFLEKYKSKSQLSENDKMALSFALQKMIVEKVFVTIKNLSKACNDRRREANASLEPWIIYDTEHLIGLLKRFADKCQGGDDLTRILPTKIRQQIFASLGTLSYKGQDATITSLTKSIIKEMDPIRQILSEDRKKDLHRETTNLIIDLVHLYFRIQAQEPIPAITWIDSGKSIHTGLMTGPFDIEDSENLEVDICYFPAIGIHLYDQKNRKVYCKAQVLARTKGKKEPKKGGLIPTVYDVSDSEYDCPGLAQAYSSQTLPNCACNDFIITAEIKAQLQETHPNFEVCERTCDELSRLGHITILSKSVSLLNDSSKEKVYTFSGYSIKKMIKNIPPIMCMMTSKTSMSCFAKASPDLKPIENIWAI